MSLTAALDSARASLMASGIQSSTISRNIAGATATGYSRKIAVLDNLPGAGVYVAAIQRAASSGLYNNVLIATSGAAKQNAILDGLQKISASTVDDPELGQSPAAQLNKLKQALQQYANAPDNTTLAQAAVTSAKDMATSLNQATKTVQTVREGADADMATSVANINQLLTQFDKVNTAIVKGTIAGDDVTDYLDQRDNIVSKMSQEVGVSMTLRANGDAALYTDSGVVLFDKTARSVSFAATNIYTPGTTGNAVYIDGVPVTGANSVMPIKTGKLAGLAQLRDNATVTYQSQLDEVARGLVEAFKEVDQSGAALPDRPGLFTYPGSPAMPASATVSVGLAGSISVAASVDPAQGGNPNLLRDGAISGNVAYRYNTTGNAGYSVRLQQLIGNMDASQPFDATTQGKPTGSLIDFAASSTSWIENQRKAADDNATYQNTLLDRSTAALSNVSGVNMDDEMSLMLQVERTYSASSKIISTVDQMLQSLLAAVGN
ncbi:flagellar hook-associated protein FlgK [Bradyrhizobium japonicum]|uniref:flagellar hook-associated protein FlgK n=1 Tax=Bradyrhizobium japonicum TaxID=375 RepID=UPI00057E1C62|nr:flagellar hook-associated protein FlgK [Bradyrhizobium japonicum]MCD9106718.1 flagellar hook-associated protein FlgK [Bradyrhizobium japonicum]MCD9254058.1 flagellar hook-associated protein FlgK [Bradyrhizobium japonicum SEMIA 5079]MCD9817926.1 flagellar hook-associated protein FlgK [Bradyrhizobium japonicum]MCD9890948.1 flagellar hook-associated protein FlgK [Bradyrhizobium japonicum]MCD9905455.1 flagellar hook-associated protein FlgK [Bradyrhizobium japonicum]